MVLLVGTDDEGETREDWIQSLHKAIHLGRECLAAENGWLRFEVWANAGRAGRWKRVYSQAPSARPVRDGIKKPNGGDAGRKSSPGRGGKTTDGP